MNEEATTHDWTASAIGKNIQEGMSSSVRCRCFEAVMGLAWSDDPESCSCDSVTTGRIFNAGQVKGDDSDKKGCPDPPSWGLGVVLLPHPIQICLLRSF